MQQNAIMEPVLAKAARQLGIDAVALHRINAPAGKAPFGPPGKEGKRSYVTSAFVREALDRGAELFDWNERKARSRQRRGATVRGVGVSVSPFIGGYSIGYDGLMTIRPDGKLYVQSGVGNLGTHSVIDTARVAAEVLDMPWDRVEVVWGDTSKHLPWTCTSDGSQTDARDVARQSRRRAWTRSASCRRSRRRTSAAGPEDYGVGGARVYRSGVARGTSRSRRPPQRAIALGGKYDGHELPADIHAMTQASATALAGRADGRGEGHLSARRRDALLRRRLRRGRSRRRDRRR